MAKNLKLFYAVLENVEKIKKMLQKQLTRAFYCDKISKLSDKRGDYSRFSYQK